MRSTSVAQIERPVPVKSCDEAVLNGMLKMKPGRADAAAAGSGRFAAPGHFVLRGRKRNAP